MPQARRDGAENRRTQQHTGNDLTDNCRLADALRELARSPPGDQQHDQLGYEDYNGRVMRHGRIHYRSCLMLERERVLTKAAVEPKAYERAARER